MLSFLFDAYLAFGLFTVARVVVLRLFQCRGSVS